MESARVSNQRRFVGITLSIILAGFLVIGLTGCIQPTPPNPAGDTPLTQRSSDGFRYDENHQSLFPYGTMIYFNFRDDTHDLIGIFGYGVFYSESPLFAADANYYSTFAAYIPPRDRGDSMRLWAPNDPIPTGGVPPYSTTFNEGPDNYEYESPSGYIDVRDAIATPPGSTLADTYHIVGSITENGQSISWDLTFERVEVPGWFPWEKWPLPKAAGIFPNSWIDYYVGMGVAKVNGTFVVDYDAEGPQDPIEYDIIDAKGEHEGFQGEFLFTEVQWDWVDYKQWTQDPLPPGVEPDVDFWVELLNQPGPYYECQGGWAPCNPGNLRAYYDGNLYDFYRGRNPSEDQIEVQRFGWTPDPDFGGQYPTEEIVTGENDDNYICIHWEVVEDEVAPGVFEHRVEMSHWDLPAPLQDNVTYEFVSNVEGSLIAKKEGGDCSACEADCTAECSECGTTLKTFSGVGYTDYVGAPFDILPQP